MPARDRYHDNVRNALVKDGWTITHDPFRVIWHRKDLESENLIAAEKFLTNIAVQVLPISPENEWEDLTQAIGQFTLLRCALDEINPYCTLFFAVCPEMHPTLFDRSPWLPFLGDCGMHLLRFDLMKQTVIAWIPAKIVRVNEQDLLPTILPEPD